MSVRSAVCCDGCGREMPPPGEPSACEGWVSVSAAHLHDVPAPQMTIAVEGYVSHGQRVFGGGRVDFCSVDCMAGTLRGWVEAVRAKRAEDRLQGFGHTTAGRADHQHGSRIDLKKPGSGSAW